MDGRAAPARNVADDGVARQWLAAAREVGEQAARAQDADLVRAHRSGRRRSGQVPGLLMRPLFFQHARGDVPAVDIAGPQREQQVFGLGVIELVRQVFVAIVVDPQPLELALEQLAPLGDDLLGPGAGSTGGSSGWPGESAPAPDRG